MSKPKAFIISLARVPERRDNSIKEAEKSGLDWEIFDALDGRAFKREDGTTDWESLREIQPWDSSNAGREFMASEIAIYASHLSVFRRILNLGLDYAVILEDDFFIRNAAHSIEEVCEELARYKNRWDHCLLHADVLSLNGSYRMRGVFEDSRTLNIVRETGLICVAYAVTAKFARYVLECEYLMKEPVDNMLCRLSRDDGFTFIQPTFPLFQSVGFPTTQE